MKLWKLILHREWTPTPQGPIGLKIDQDFAELEPGIIERLAGYFRGVPVYRERPPKPTWVRDPRAIANEKAAAERRRARRGDVPISFIDDGNSAVWYRDHPPYQANDL